MTEPYHGDLAKTGILFKLFEVSPEKRDESWQKVFLATVTEASFACGDPQLIKGPDGFPYVHLITPEAEKEFQCFVIKHMEQDFLLKEGFGIVINPAKEKPDWVFTYGDIVNLHLNKEYYSERIDVVLPEDETLSTEQEVLIAQPSETYLPQLTRQVLKHYFELAKIENVKILLMTRKTHEGVIQEIVFNLTPDKFENEVEYQKIMKDVSWFLPRHYFYSVMDEKEVSQYFRDL
ncbi:MAG: hypothetical protein KBC84_08735 [Proteobacteria bacterium]|nr:hypothetical protein [Pseudomonadota bacterium]